jgi:phosphoglycolate phosphatase
VAGVGMRVSGLVFDFDGTLMDSAPAIAEALSEVRVVRGGDAADLDLVRKMVSHGAKDLVTRVLGEWSTTPDNDLIAFRKIYGAMKPNRAHLYPGAEPALRALQTAGLRLGICTNKPQGLTERIVAELGLGEHFSAIVGGGGCAYTKPDPGHAFETLTRMGVPACEALYVGDSEVDSETAAAAKLPFVLVTFGYPLGDPDAISADARVDRFEDLLDSLTVFRGMGGL